MDPNVIPQSGQSSQVITLSCRCIIPEWRLIGDSLVCNVCKTRVNINNPLKQLILQDKDDIKQPRSSDTLNQIKDALCSLQRSMNIAEQSEKENEILQSILKEKDDRISDLTRRIKESETTREYFNSKKQSMDSIDFSSLIKSILSCITDTENDLKDYSENLPVLINHIQNNMITLRDKLEECGFKLISHERGIKISSDDNLYVDIECDSTGVKC